jgi:hypothetical protein
MESLAMLVRLLFKGRERGVMSKLLNLKKWVTTPEAAKHLSKVLGEEVSEADILQLALNDKLQLSVYFPNGFTFNRWETVKKNRFEVDDRTPTPKEIAFYEIEARNWLDDKNEELSITGPFRFGGGVFELLMIGNGETVIENYYQKLTGGVEINANPSNGGIFFEEGKSICEILIRNYDGEYKSALDLAYDGIIVVKSNRIANFDKYTSKTTTDNNLTTNEYSTKWLKIQQAAIAKFFNPRLDLAAKKHEVSTWINGESINAGLGVSKNISEAIFTIIKPDDHLPRKKIVKPQ